MMHWPDLTKKNKKVVLYFLLGIGALFLLLTLYVSLLPTSYIDIEFSEEIQESRNPLLDTIMKMVSWFGNRPQSVLFPVVVALMFFVFRYRKEALFVLLTLVASVINFGIKILINRPRPTDDLVKVIVDAKHQSFPSGHTVQYVVLFGFLSFLMYHLPQPSKTFRIIVAVMALVLVFTVPFSRVYLGAHWFTDVAAGFLLGLLFLSGLIYLYLNKS